MTDGIFSPVEEKFKSTNVFYCLASSSGSSSQLKDIFHEMGSNVPTQFPKTESFPNSKWDF